MSGFVNEIPKGYDPVEVVIRHPDAEDDIYQYGLEHLVVYLDLGASFDVTKVGRNERDREAVEEWAEGIFAQIEGLPADHPAREKVEEVVEETLELVRRRCAVCGTPLDRDEEARLAEDRDFIQHGDPPHLIRVES